MARGYEVVVGALLRVGQQKKDTMLCKVTVPWL